MYEAIPDELKQCRNWVCWRYVERGGKKTKIPVNPRTGGAAKSNDPGTWADFSLAGFCSFRGCLSGTFG